MFKNINSTWKNLHNGQKGMTGLETAMISIAFVTVASVLAYSVLSAGIFSAEKGKSTVYSGLEQAQATMETRGPVVADSADNVTVDYVEFLVGLTIPGETVDMNALSISTFSANHTVDLTNADWATGAPDADTWQYELAPGCTERGTAKTLEGDELMVVKVDATTLEANSYSWFTTQILPPKGASITIRKVLPGELSPKMDLN